jgi:hypothetical protein
MFNDMNEHVCIDDLKFPYIINPGLDKFLRKELKNAWAVKDWQQMRLEVCSEVDNLLMNGGKKNIAWHGESPQAYLVFCDLLKKYKHEGLKWFWIARELGAIDNQLGAKNITVNDWKANGFGLTVVADHDAAKVFKSDKPADKNIISPFSDKDCQIRAWNANFRNAEKFAEKINTEVIDNKVVVFIALRHGNFPSIEHIANSLKQISGVKVYGLYLEPDTPGNVYDDIFSCNYSLGLLAEVLRRLSPVSIYLQAHARWAYLGQFVKSINKDLRVIQEVYDWMGAFISDERLFSDEGVFTLDQISLMQQAEDYICHSSDGYLYKDDGPWMKERVNESKCPSIKLYPGPPSRFYKTPVEPIESDVVKLVYAGQVSHVRQSRKIFGDMYYMPLLKDLTGQGFHVTIYNAVQNSRRTPAELYKEYLDEAVNNELFEFNDGVPMPEILDELHGIYHYGLIAYYFDDDLHVGVDHLRGTMASKLFTYIASGLPVIVSEEFGYMARIVETEGIGIVVGKKDLKNLTPVLAACDYNELLNNIMAAREKYSIESKIPEIMELLGI